MLIIVICIDHVSVEFLAGGEYNFNHIRLSLICSTTKKAIKCSIDRK